MADKSLQVFHTVSKVLSFTKASEILHMTQPAVTFQIKQLEESFNTRLFNRMHNKISLTEAGKIVYYHAENILGHYDKMINEVRGLTEEVAGSLMIGASATIAEYMLPLLLGEFKKKFPDITISMQVGNTDFIISMVENNLIDLGMVEGPVFNKNLEVNVCRVDEMQLICPPNHPLANKDKVTIDEIKKYPYISREKGSGSRLVIERFINKQNLSCEDFDVALEMGSLEALKTSVEAGIGLSISSKITVLKELKLGTLKSIPINPPIKRDFSHVRQKQKFRHRAVGELLDFSIDYCKQNTK